MVGWILDLIELAQQNTWFTVVLLWIGTAVAYRSLHNDIQETHDDVDSLADSQGELAEQVNRVDQKQDHVVSRQEMMLERMGVNAQEIQELREDTARLDERHRQEDTFYRGGNSHGEGD
ncbi:hypothetical protein HHTV1_23 [Haloarcula hispanica tailed virus 1]|uniref:Uncharacterized protein n=1 Tax=Haloarcula hispanica tailed virus 1 TaxID=1273750 RepID=R4T6F4_9CAUD|nr:hypothetical protein M198_gp23 [Haloarcula hispanica tailed virus 1]AGM11279.1 hypothetical protein HHTV1_23 [Haloarcula hispanica tailed virus 1]